jgi:hypothetical protein
MLSGSETAPSNALASFKTNSFLFISHLVKLELLSNATTIDSALNYIRNKQQEQHQK